MPKAKDVTLKSNPEKFSTAIYKLTSTQSKNCYAHACKGCGTIRFFNMKHITAVRCQPCAEKHRRENPKRTPPTCERCGQPCLTVWRSKRPPRFCSVLCRNKAGAIDSSLLLTRTCKHCHKTFTVTPNDARRRVAESCSNTCRTGHHLWIDCAHCGNHFNARHNTTRRFCSKRCYLSSWSESRIEKQVRISLESYGLDFETQFPIKGAHHFDFYVSALNLLIEADGTYWHSRPWSKERDAKKTAKAEALGYCVERFPESLIMSDEWTNAFDATIARHLQKRENSDIDRLPHRTATAQAQGLLHP
jgi:very-short-patch-repair endonuclease